MSNEQKITLTELGRGKMGLQLGTPERRKVFGTFLASQGISSTFNTHNAEIEFKKKDLTHILGAAAELMVQMNDAGVLEVDRNKSSLSIVTL